MKGLVVGDKDMDSGEKGRVGEEDGTSKGEHNWLGRKDKEKGGW